MDSIVPCLWIVLSIAVVSSAYVHDGIQNLYIHPSFKQVTSKKQLWRFLVGEGSNTITSGDKYLCLRTNQGKYLRNMHNRGIRNLANDCGADERWEPINHGDGRWILKASNDERALGCYGGGAIGYRVTFGFPYKPRTGKVDWVAQKLWINEAEDTLVVQGHPNGGFVTTQYNAPHVDCQNDWKLNMYLTGWRTGRKSDWEPKDGNVVVADCDNTDPRSKSGITCIYSRVVGEQRSTERSKTVSTSVTVGVEKGFGKTFSVSVSSTVGYDWSRTSSETFSRSHSSTAQVTVLPGYRVQVLQTVGTLGPFEFRTPSFKTKVIVAPPGAIDFEHEMLDSIA